MKQILKLTTLFTLMLIIFSSCSKSTTESKDPVLEPIISKNAVVVDVATQDNFEAMTENTLVFSESTPLLDSLVVGNVLVDDISDVAPYGYLRKIVGIAKDADGSISIQTEQATLPDVIEQMDFGFCSDTLETDVAEITLSDDVKLVQNNDKLLGFDFDYAGYLYKEGDDYIHVEGSAYFDLSYNFALKYTLLPLECYYFKASVEVEQSASLGITSNLDHTINERIKLAEITFTPWVFYVSFLPIVFVPEVVLYVGADGQITAEASAWCAESYNGEVGFKKKNGEWQQIWVNDLEYDYSLPEVQSSLNFNSYFGPEAKLMLYGVAGPKINLFGFGDLTATFSNEKDVDITFDIGAEANAGVTVEIFGIVLVDKEMNIFDEILYTYEYSGSGVENSIKINNPTSGSSYILGETIDISALVTGEQVEKVEFFINNELVYTDSEEPYEYSWLTEDEETGNYEICAKAYFPSETLTSEISNVALTQGSWHQIDLSDQLGPMDDILSIYFIDENHGWFCGGEINDNKQFIYKTVDGGESWSMVYESDEYLNDAPLTDILFFGPDEGICVGGFKILWSINGGETWSEDTGYNVVNKAWHSVTVKDNGDLVVAGDECVAIKTSLSADWIIAEYPDTPQGIIYWGGVHRAIDFGESSNGTIVGMTDYLNGDTPYIVDTQNGGYAWTIEDAQLSSEHYLQGVSYADEQYGFICGDDYGMYQAILMKTEDGGSNWQSIDPVTAQGWMCALTDIQFLDRYSGYTCGGQYVYMTNDSGTHWSEWNSGSYYDDFYDLFYLDKNHGWVGGAAGGLYKYSAGK